MYWQPVLNCIPASISEHGKLRNSTKSDLLIECPESISPSSHIQPDSNAKILHGAAIVHFLKPRSCKTFKEHADQIFLPYIDSQLKDVDHVDLVWDCFVENSLKRSTRDDRKARLVSRRQRLLPSSPIPSQQDSSSFFFRW